MIKEVVGVVTEEEKNEILVLFERELGIEELAATLDSGLLQSEENDILKDKILNEQVKVKKSLQRWWDMMYEKYKWKNIDGYRWGIDFQTCDIYLTE